MYAAPRLLTRSRAAIARFESTKIGGNLAEFVEARAALERCYAEVKRFAKKRRATCLPNLTGPTELDPIRGTTGRWI